MTITRNGVPAIKDPTGRVLDFGVVKHVMEWNPAISSTVPAWLTTQGTGTFTPVSKTTGKPGLIIQGNSLSGNGAQLVCTEPILLDRLNAVMVEVQGVETLTTPTTPGNFCIGATKDAALSTATAGAFAIVNQAGGTASRMLHAPSANLVTDYSPNSSTLRNQNMYKGLNSGFLIDFTKKHTYLLDGDQFVGRASAPGLLAPTGETVRPGISFRPGAVGDQIHISGLRITLWYD